MPALTKTRPVTPTPVPTNGDGQKTVNIHIPAPAVTLFTLTLIGKTPLITDAFSAARKARLEQTQDGSPKQKPGPRVKKTEFQESMYRMPDGRWGVPKLAFRKAIMAGAMRMTDVKGTEALASFTINTPDEYLPLIDVGEPIMREDHVVRMGRGNMCYRAEFWPWSVRVPIMLDHEVLSLDQFVHLVGKAGMGIGIGNWRPEKKGDYGQWKVGDLVEDVFVSGQKV